MDKQFAVKIEKVGSFADKEADKYAVISYYRELQNKQNREILNLPEPATGAENENPTPPQPTPKRNAPAFSPSLGISPKQIIVSTSDSVPYLLAYIAFLLFVMLIIQD